MDNMTKLAVLLAKADIPFELRGITCGDSSATVQICSPSVENCLIDAICHHYSYGGDQVCWKSSAQAWTMLSAGLAQRKHLLTLKKLLRSRESNLPVFPLFRCKTSKNMY